MKPADLASIAVLAIIVAMSWWLGVLLVQAQLQHTDILRFEPIGLVRYLGGTAIQPFAYRVLTPWLIRIVLALHLDRLAIPELDPMAQAACGHLAPAIGSCAQVKAYVIVASGCAAAFLLATYALAVRCLGSIPWAVLSFVLTALSANALLLQGHGHIYDFPAAFAGTILFLLAAEQRDLAFTVVFVFACGLKESLFLYAPVFALIGRGARPPADTMRTLLLHTALFVVIYGSERIVYAGNGGAPMFHDIGGQIAYIVQRTDFSVLAACAVFALLLVYRLPQKPAAVRRAMSIIPAFLLLYAIGGSPGEFRIVLDIFPVLLLPIVDSCRRLVASA